MLSVHAQLWLFLLSPQGSRISQVLFSTRPSHLMGHLGETVLQISASDPCLNHTPLDCFWCGNKSQLGVRKRPPKPTKHGASTCWILTLRQRHREGGYEALEPRLSGSVTSFRMSHEIVPVHPAQMSHHIVPVDTPPCEKCPAGVKNPLSRHRSAMRLVADLSGNGTLVEKRWPLPVLP